jgi:hypothetical protein
MVEQHELSVRTWAPIVGFWTFDENGRAIYTGGKPEIPYGVCVSNVRFSEGEARVTVRPSGPLIDGRILLGYRSTLHEIFVVGIGGTEAAYTIAQFVPYAGWRELIRAGRKENLSADRPYVVSVRVRGQRVTLEVDSIRIFEHVLERPIPFGQLGLFSWGLTGGVEFSDMTVKGERGNVFVVMQYSGFEELYTDVILPVTRSFGLRPYRADEVYGPGNLLADIVDGIETSQIVIAEITPPNENVFYEVGYAHALKKPTILLADQTKRLPFDLTGYRCLFYENSIGGKRKVEDGLRKHLEAILHE